MDMNRRSLLIVPGLIAAVILLTILLLPAAAQQIGSNFEPAECWFEDKVPFLPGPEFECGYVIVPKRHENPDGPTIKIPVAISRSQEVNRKPDPLFLAQGGPGGDAFEVFPILLSASSAWQDRDIVIFNQRGTRYAEPDLSCTELFDAAADIMSMPPEDADQASLDLLQACYDRVVADGVDVSAFNSLENAADVDAIRQALGYDEYNFYGVSYGTLLGLHLLRDHPQHLRSAILDGVVPTNLNFILKVAENTDRVFTEIIDTCQEDTACNSQYPNLEERFFTLVDSLNESPVTIKMRDPETGQLATALLDGDTLVEVLFQAFYLPDSYAVFPKLIANLEEGDMTFIEGIWPLFAFDRTISEGMYFSVICAEDADFDTSDLQLDDIRPYFAENADEELSSYSDACEIWQVDRLPASVDDPVTGDTPVLLLSGQYDPITPPYFADVVAESLPNNTTVIDPIGSHGVAWGDPCMDSIVSQFLDHPTQELDTSCVSSIEPKSFAPIDALSFPFIGEVNQLTDAVWWQVGSASLFLLIVLSTFIILPLAWFIRVLSSKERPIESKRSVRLRRIAGLLAFLFGVLAIIFVGGVVYYTFDALFGGLANIFAISSAAGPFFALTYLLLLIAAAMITITILAWRNGYWATRARVYYSIVSIAAVAYVVVLGIGGMLTVLL
ncbi:MAG: alpha/beta fold hydrolase [Candidatus Promineifilaceae bacterium]